MTKGLGEWVTFLTGEVLFRQEEMTKWESQGTRGKQTEKEL